MKFLFAFLAVCLSLLFAAPCADAQAPAPVPIVPPPVEEPFWVKYGVAGALILGAFTQLRKMNDTLTLEMKTAIENNTAALNQVVQVVGKLESRMDNLEREVRDIDKQ